MKAYLVILIFLISGCAMGPSLQEPIAQTPVAQRALLGGVFAVSCVPGKTIFQNSINCAQQFNSMTTYFNKIDGSFWQHLSATAGGLSGNTKFDF